VVNWTRFDPAQFDIEFNEDKLAAHGIRVNEAAEVLWNGFRPLRDKDHDDRYRLLGRTDGERALELVVVVLGKRRLRIITGWPL
jgi:uncharacterized DUF497 family protein